MTAKILSSYPNVPEWLSEGIANGDPQRAPEAPFAGRPASPWAQWSLGNREHILITKIRIAVPNEDCRRLTRFAEVNSTHAKGSFFVEAVPQYGGPREHSKWNSETVGPHFFFRGRGRPLRRALPRPLAMPEFPETWRSRKLQASSNNKTMLGTLLHSGVAVDGVAGSRRRGALGGLGAKLVIMVNVMQH